MIQHFLQLPENYYPIDGCALLVRDALKLIYNINNLPKHQDKNVTLCAANEMINLYKSKFLQKIEVPEHAAMVIGNIGEKWHCGIFTTEQAPNYVIHTVNKKIKIETLNQFKNRFNNIEFYKYVSRN